MARRLIMLALVALGAVSFWALPAGAAAHHGDPGDGTAYDMACHKNPSGRPCVCYKGLTDEQPTPRIEMWDDGSCALRYLQRNLGALWKFAAVLAGSLATGSLVWAGFVLMQDSVNGEGIARARTIVVRVLVGVLIVAMGSFVMEALFLDLFGVPDFWFSNDGKYFRTQSWQELLLGR